eukprot:COSAG05_NODE_3503_length_2024_cov_4.038442_2_plen_248_part_00
MPPCPSPPQLLRQRRRRGQVGGGAHRRRRCRLPPSLRPAGDRGHGRPPPARRAQWRRRAERGNRAAGGGEGSVHGAAPPVGGLGDPHRGPYRLLFSLCKTVSWCYPELAVLSGKNFSGKNTLWEELLWEEHSPDIRLVSLYTVTRVLQFAVSLRTPLKLQATGFSHTNTCCDHCLTRRLCPIDFCSCDRLSASTLSVAQTEQGSSGARKRSTSRPPSPGQTATPTPAPTRCRPPAPTAAVRRRWSLC